MSAASTEAIDQELTEGFKHYLYHYPDSTAPRVIAYVSRFNQGLLTVGNFVGVGLDQYLGAECKYYDQMGTPRYLLNNKRRDRIPVDVMHAYATRLYPYNDSLDNVLSRMIHHGQMLYFVDAMLPDFDCIIISPETRPTAEEINNIRKQKGKKPLQIIQIPFVLADDNVPISSTRIRNKEINKDGSILTRD